MPKKTPGATRSRAKPKSAAQAARPPKPPAKRPAKSPPPGGGVSTMVAAWEDDPASQPVPKPVQRPVPDLSAKALSVTINGKKPAPKLYQHGTPEFRYWAAAEALRRAADFWSKIVPKGFAWQVGSTLPVHLDVGTDLNAFYTRGGGGDQPGLNFFHDTVNGVVYYSGESPEVTCHEFGHAVLDAVRPELFNAAFAEVAAFHESFGDMSAILSVLQLQSVRVDLLATVGRTIYRNSRVSRLAEQLGFAIRQRAPDAVDSDSLRNAVNTFFYRDPQQLPPNAPSTMLSSEPHSFSRLFTSAFLEILGGIFSLQGAPGSEQQLLAATRIAGDLIIRAAIGASVVPGFYSQVAAQFISADATQYGKKYRDAIKGAFVRRGILSLESASSGVPDTAPARTGRAFAATAVTAAEVPQTAVMAMASNKYGLEKPLYVEAPGSAPHFSVAAAAASMGSLDPVSREFAAQSYVEDLFRRGRVEHNDHGDPDSRVSQPLRRKTHELVEQGDGLKLERLYFDCGFDGD